MIYFLGSNSGNGFSSLYEDFPPEEGAFLHIIKGGPGSGKSTLMKGLAATAEARGWTVHRVPCSGDPDSLDGVYVPALREAWVDGTAPHALEPKLFGVTGDYLNLGSFFRGPLDQEEKQLLLRLQRDNQELYREATLALRDCAEKGGGRTEACSEEPLRRRINALPRREQAGKLRRCFLSAISCKGYLQLRSVFEGYTLGSAEPEDLAEAAEELRRKGWEAVLALSPLEPARAEALLLPEQRLAFLVKSNPTAVSSAHMEHALSLLAEAKALHDEMEALYAPHMDFAGLSQLQEELRAKLAANTDL